MMLCVWVGVRRQSLLCVLPKNVQKKSLPSVLYLLTQVLYPLLLVVPGVCVLAWSSTGLMNVLLHCYLLQQSSSHVHVKLLLQVKKTSLEGGSIGFLLLVSFLLPDYLETPLHIWSSQQQIKLMERLSL